MDKQLLKSCDSFQLEMMKFLGNSINEIKTNQTFADCEIILAFGADAMRGALADAKHTSATAIVRSARGLFETYLDTEILKNDPNPQNRIKDFKEYALVDQEKFKRINGHTSAITSQETSAVAAFTNPTTGKPYKHWSKMNSIAQRANSVGRQSDYDTFYRVASLAVHGSSAFGIFYKDKQSFTDIQEGNLAISVGFTFGIFENCVSITNVTDSNLTSNLQQMKIFKDKIIIS